MFSNLKLNNSNFTLFQFRKKWYFDLSHFCLSMQMSNECSNLRDSLVDYEKSIRTTPRQKTFFIVYDFETVKNDIYKSNCFESKQGSIVNKNVEIFLELIKNVDSFIAIDFVFFCQYLQTMFQKWDLKKQSMTSLEFQSHLEKRCFFWSKILDSLQSLEPLIHFYHHCRRPLPLDAKTETDHLLQYLELLQQKTVTNEKSNDSLEQVQLKIASENSVAPLQQNAIKHEIVSKNESNHIVVNKKRSLTIRDRIAIAADQNWECFYCLKLLDECFQVDHIERFCESGNDHHSNLWALCASCHAKKDEWDRKRRKTNIWSDYRQLSASEKFQKRQDILSKIEKL